MSEQNVLYPSGQLRDIQVFPFVVCNSVLCLLFGPNPLPPTIAMITKPFSSTLLFSCALQTLKCISQALLDLEWFVYETCWFDEPHWTGSKPANLLPWTQSWRYSDVCPTIFLVATPPHPCTKHTLTHNAHAYVISVAVCVHACLCVYLSVVCGVCSFQCACCDLKCCFLLAFETDDVQSYRRS